MVHAKLLALVGNIEGETSIYNIFFYLTMTVGVSETLKH